MPPSRKTILDTGSFVLFVVPAAVLIGLAFYGPFLMNLYYSLTNWNGIQSQPGLVGFDNFVELLDDSDFGASIGFTAVFAAVYIILSNALALLLAVLLDQKLRFANGLRAALFVPYILSLVVVGFIWNFLLGAGWSSLAASTGWPVFQTDLLGNAQTAFWTVALVSVWQSLGFYIVLYHAGLQTIPGETLEAAAIDGARASTRFFRVTLPMLGASVTSAVFFSLAASIRVYDVIVSLTRGGPGRATASVTFDIYTEAFTNNRYGYGTAKSLVLLAAVVVISVIQLRLMKGREVEV